MLEDSTGMDKKPNGRSLQVPTKSGAEVKNLDSNKPFGKNNRRREPTSSSSNKNDPLRRPNNSAKAVKYSDKQPRSRSQYYGGGKAQTKVDLEEEGPEYGPVFTRGSRRQNLTNLVNFTLTPRESSRAYTSGRLQWEKRGNWSATQKHKYNKEEFLQANCQFVVKANEDYSSYLVDPDILVEWNLIEQVRQRSTEDINCTICLSAPRAAKMTRCGHIFCWPCILRYLATSETTWKKCPICFEAVHVNDLKSAVVISNKPSEVGREATFRLMKREKNSCTVVPVSENDYHRSEAVPLSIAEPVLSIAYSKLLVATQTEVDAMLKTEKMELNVLLDEAFDDFEVSFIQRAIELLEERVRGSTDKGARVGRAEVLETSDTSSGSEGACGGAIAEVEESIDSKGEEEEFEEACFVENRVRISSSEDDFELSHEAPEDIETEGQMFGEEPFFFYQAMDGQNVFLLALNIRMLKAEHDGFDRCPLTITGQVLEKQDCSMTRELRRHQRALAHLPVTTAFEVVELDMRPLVRADILERYASELGVRAKRRRQRDLQERRREKRITHEVAKQWGRQPAPYIHLDSARHFPRCGEEEAGAEPPSPSNSSFDGSLSPSISSAISAEVEMDNFPPMPSSSEDTAGRTSFAQMCKAGAPWGRVKPSWPAMRQTDVVTHEDVNDHSSVPRFQHSISEAIAQALERADLNHDNDDSSSSNKKKKKKIKNKKPLFTSGMPFCAN